MKRVLLIFLMVLLALSALFASEPSVLISSLSPLALYSGSMEEERIDLSEIYYDLKNVAIPLIVKDSEFSLLDLASLNPFKIGSAIFNGVMAINSYNDSTMISGSGAITISPDYSFIKDGKAAVALAYDDVSLLYTTGGITEGGNIDGEVIAIITWSTPRLLELSIISDTTLEKGSLDLAVDFDRSKVDRYLSAIGSYGLDDLRLPIAYYIIDMIGEEAASMLLGLESLDNLDQSSLEKLIKEKEMDDIIDLVTFFLIVSEGSGLSLSEAFTMAIKTELTVDNKDKDINLDRLIKNALRIYNVVETFT